MSCGSHTTQCKGRSHFRPALHHQKVILIDGERSGSGVYFDWHNMYWVCQSASRTCLFSGMQQYLNCQDIHVPRLEGTHSCYVKMQYGRYFYVLEICAGSGSIHFHCQSMAISTCIFDLPQTVGCQHPSVELIFLLPNTKN